MTSERKRAANKQNAQKSTGPKNTTYTKNNSFKHGLYAQKQFISEKQRPVFDRLSRNIRRQLKPRTWAEHNAVDSIVYCAWQCELCHVLDLQTVTKQLSIFEQESLLENSSELSVVGGWYGTSREHARQGVRLLDQVAGTVKEGLYLSADLREEVTKCFGPEFLAAIADWSISDNEVLQMANMLSGKRKMFGSEPVNLGDGPLVVADPAQTRELMLKLIAMKRQHVEEARLIWDQKTNGLGGGGTTLAVPRHADRARKSFQQAMRWLLEIRSSGL